MCVIIANPLGKRVPDSILASSSVINPHGLGVVFLDNGDLIKTDSNDYDMLRCERPYIAHFRYATVGKVSLDNCHPFHINDESILFQNGTVSNLGNLDLTDTEHLANILSTVPEKNWRDILEMTDCRFTTVNTKTLDFDVYNEELWIEQDDVWYSKENVLEYQHVIAVYGTLKKGYSNYQRYKNDLKYLGSGQTVDKYPLLIQGLPYVLPNKGKGHNVSVDVFITDDYGLDGLDLLEGHPDWYKREQIPVQLEDGRKIIAWLYFNDTVKDTGKYEHTYTEKITKSKYGSYWEKDYDYFQSRDWSKNKASWEDDAWVLPSETEDVEVCPACGSVECMNDSIEEAIYCFECGEYTYLEQK